MTTDPQVEQGPPCADAGDPLHAHAAELLALCKRILNRRPIGGRAADIRISEETLADLAAAVDRADPDGDYFGKGEYFPQERA